MEHEASFHDTTRPIASRQRDAAVASVLGAITERAPDLMTLASTVRMPSFLGGSVKRAPTKQQRFIPKAFFFCFFQIWAATSLARCPIRINASYSAPYDTYI